MAWSSGSYVCQNTLLAVVNIWYRCLALRDEHVVVDVVREAAHFYIHGTEDETKYQKETSTDDFLFLPVTRVEYHRAFFRLKRLKPFFLDWKARVGDWMETISFFFFSSPVNDIYILDRCIIIAFFFFFHNKNNRNNRLNIGFRWMKIRWKIMHRSIRSEISRLFRTYVAFNEVRILSIFHFVSSTILSLWSEVNTFPKRIFAR